jgi:hypothetical protein
MMIAVRYAFMAQDKYSLMYKSQTSKYVFDDILLASWLFPGFESIDKEIKSSMKRFNIEKDDFNFQFLCPLSEDFHQRLLKDNYYKTNGIKMNDAIKQYKAKNKGKIIPTEEEVIKIKSNVSLSG